MPYLVPVFRKIF